MKQTRSNLIKENQSNFKQTQVSTNRSEVNRSHEKLNESNEIINTLVNVYYEPNNKYKINCFKCSLEKLEKCNNECLCLKDVCENLNKLSDKIKIIQEENNNQKLNQINKKSSLNNLNQLINKINFNQNEKRLSSSNQSVDEIKLLSNPYQSKEQNFFNKHDNLLQKVTKSITNEINLINQTNDNCLTIERIDINNDTKCDETNCVHMNYKIVKEKSDLFANKKKLSWLENISKLSSNIKNSLNKSFFELREDKQIDSKLNNSISEPIMSFENKKKMKTLVLSNKLNDDLSTSDSNKTKFTEKINSEPQTRETWNKKAEFLLAVIGFAVDLGNVWRFPYICYRNGGGAFLIPYFIMMIFGGLPLFYLELALGQYYRTGCLSLWKKICPMMKGIGYAICFIDLYMGMYYNTIIAWALYYFFSSLTTTLPWTHCSNSWNTKNCKTIYERKLYQNNSSSFTSPAQEFFELSVLEISKSSGIEDLGYIKPSMAACLATIFLMVYFSLWKGVRSTGKAVWFTAIMPYILLTILLIRGLTLEGSLDGIHYFLNPNWSKLLEINVWIDAATQTFFSLGPGFGTLLALSSYNKFNNNCYKDALITSTINCLTSILSGFVIFSVLGFMAKMMNKEIGNVATDGPGLVFIIYPEAIGTMKFSWIWSLFFFLMLITLGLDSTFGGLEAIITGLCDEYPSLLRKNREIFVAFLIIFIYICALPTVTFGGNYIVNLLDTYGTAMSVLFVVLIESITISWLYGTKKIASQIEEMHGNKPSYFWIYCWQFISPVFLSVVFVSAIIRTRSLVLEEYVYPPWSINLGWLITCSSMFCVPIYIIYSFFIAKGTFSQRLILMIRPPPLNISENLEKITNSSQV